MLKKIETKKQIETKENKKRTIALIIAAIFVLSTVGFALMQGNDSEEKQEYNGHSFIRRDNLWQTQVDNQIIKTNYLPHEVENITEISSSIPRQAFSNKIIYFISKTQEEKRAVYMISQYIPSLRAQYVCFPGDNTSECQNLPEKSCENLTVNSALIIIKDTSEKMYPSYVNITINETFAQTQIEEKYFLDYKINETRIKYSPNCLEILGKKEDLTKVVEKAIFLMFGIIK